MSIPWHAWRSNCNKKQQRAFAKPLANVLLIAAAAVPLCTATSLDTATATPTTDWFAVSTSPANSNVVAETTGQRAGGSSTQYDTLSTGSADYANMFETTATSSSSGISVTLTSSSDLSHISLPLTGTSSAEFVVLANGSVILNGTGGEENGAGMFSSQLTGATNNVQPTFVPVIYTRFAPALSAPIISVPAGVPEPGTYFITGLGLAVLGAAASVIRRRRAA